MDFDTPAAGDGAMSFEIDFRAGGRGQEFLIAGWSHPEKDYTWTLGKTSLVRFPGRGLGGDHALRFRCGAMTRPGQVEFQRLYVEVNGVGVGRLICRGPTQYEVCVPAEALVSVDAIEIAFYVPDALSPKELGGSADTRDLGVWISSLQLSPLAARAGAGEGLADKAMLMDLQSLGENCELGFVQRFVGAEPLGLFRWAYTPLSNLIAALDARFEGLGAVESLSVEVDAASEFQVIDRRFGFRNHSWAYQNAGARREDVLKREVVRLPYLARLLVEDLEAAEKLFCFHDAGHSGRERIDALQAALGRYGANWLLWICPANAESPAGTAELLGARLIAGYVDRFQPLHNVRHPSMESWLAAIRAAHALWRGREGFPAQAG